MQPQYIPMNSKAIDMTGQRFGRWLVLQYAGKHYNGNFLWQCRCDCGIEKIIDGHSLRCGNSSSCGCLNNENLGNRRRKHGMTKTRLYNIWSGIIARCTNPNEQAYPHYGGRGITMCEQWRSSFEAFYADMGEPPTDKHTIDRIDNDLGYSPENCRWATTTEQVRNQRRSLWLTYDGETLHLCEWAERLGINAHTLANRVTYLGWDAERALTTPVDKRKGQNQKKRALTAIG